MRVKTDPSYETASCSYAMDMKADSTSILRDESTLLQCVIDTFNAIVLHCQQETAVNAEQTQSTVSICRLQTRDNNINNNINNPNQHTATSVLHVTNQLFKY